MELREGIDKTVAESIADLAKQYQRGFTPVDVNISVSMIVLNDKDELVAANSVPSIMIKNYGTELEKIVRIGVKQIPVSEEPKMDPRKIIPLDKVENNGQK